MRLDLVTLNDYLSKGLLINQSHPTLPLTIWNYSRTCQFESVWDEITINCRGLVTDDKGNVVAKSFPKFWNLEEHVNKTLPNEPFDVYTKEDGSLGILFNYNNVWVFGSRGSFTSDQAIEGNKILESNHGDILNSLSKDLTYIFEIIYPENRIVKDYGTERKLVLLGAYDLTNNNDLSYNELIKLSEITGFELVKRWDGYKDITSLKNMISDDDEGFVIRFRESGRRLKIKGEEYVRLHRILTNLSSYDIWEHLMEGKSLESFLEKVPNEFDEWVRSVIKKLQDDFELKKKELEDEFWSIVDRKELASKFTKNKNRGFLFKRLNSYSDEYNKMIWMSIKPNFEKAFKHNDDE